MKSAIVYTSRTGNTKMLADEIHANVADCVYFGNPAAEALKADRIYVGFWTDKGTCDENTEKFLKTLTDQEIFLFGTAGFGGEQGYYEKILERVQKKLPKTVKVMGTFMCQGKMPMSVRERYEKMSKSPVPVPNIKGMLENFDRALSHPDAQDLENLKKKIAE